jgi:uncharacterized protein (TIGR02001 family)
MIKMKHKLITILLLIGFSLSFSSLSAQDNDSPFSAGADFYSSYVWRGVSFSGPSIQPFVDFSTGGFSIGAWGSYGFDGFTESDLYASYGFDFGLTVGLTDYYYPGSPYFNYSSGPDGAHGFEANLGYDIANFSISANYMLNEAGLAGTEGGDSYFELGYAFEYVSFFLGGGDGWHSSDGEFAIVNIGMGVSREIRINDQFSLPLNGLIILNPDLEQFHTVIGISF